MLARGRPSEIGHTGFEILIPKGVRTAEPLSKEQLRVLRTRIDLGGV